MAQSAATRRLPESATQQDLPQTHRRLHPVRRAMSFWLALTAPPGAENYQDAPTPTQRERLRRATLTSFIAPFAALSPLVLLKQAQVDLVTAAALASLTTITIWSLVLNRRGHQRTAGVILVFGIECVIQGALLGGAARTGLSTGWLQTFDLFVLPLVAAGIVVSRRSVPMFAAVHTLLILGDYYLLPHSADLVALAHVWNGDSIAFARPLLLQVAVSVLTFVEIGSTEDAIRRAERAEEVAVLQRELAEQQRQLESGIREILDTHIRVANGNYKARAPLSRSHLLWQVAASLNNMLNRLEKSVHVETRMIRMEGELRRVIAAIDDMEAGRPPLWPHPTGTVVDLLVERLKLLQQSGDLPALPDILSQPDAARPPILH